MKYILGIDIGTSNTKAIAYSEKGNVLAHTNVANVFTSQEEGIHEIDPDILLKAAVQVIGATVKQVEDAELAGISFSAAMHGIFAVDKNCTPLTNMITWADLRSKDYAIKLKGTDLGKRIYERTGTPIHPMSPLCKLMWMKDHLADVFQNAYKFISIKEYIFYRFFEEYVVDRSIASATGLFDIHDLDWNTEALQLADITANKLSAHVGALHIISGLKGAYPALLGIDGQTPFILGASDGCLAHLGSNALKSNDVSVTIGTSGAVRMMVDVPKNDSLQRIFNYLLTDHLFVSGGPVNNGGNVVQWFAMNFLAKKITTGNDFNSFVDEAVKIAPGCDGLIFLPYIYGERAPVWDADARGVFYGINGTHTQAHFMRAVLEGICFALYGILQTLEQIMGKAGKIYVSGGFIHSRKWVALLADVFGKQILVSGSEDASAAGAAIIGLKATGLINELSEVPDFFTVAETYEPNMENHKACQNNYSVYSALYDKLKDLK
jgi:gluconokinase